MQIGTHFPFASGLKNEKSFYYRAITSQTGQDILDDTLIQSHPLLADWMSVFQLFPIYP